MDRCLQDTYDRFDKNVFPEPNTGCWLWGAKTNERYGRFGVKNKLILAHRFSYTRHTGLVPDGFCVCHTCDQPFCVNPQHLFIGTPKDNHDDKVSKDRHVKGDKNPCSKLDATKVLEIRKLHRDGRTFKQLGQQYGVHKATVYLAFHGKQWGWLK